MEEKPHTAKCKHIKN